MRPYCRNNSNFTFREICCGKPLYDCKFDCKKHKDDDCDCYNDCFEDKFDYGCNCGNRKQNCSCNKPHIPCKKPPCKKKPSNCINPYICLPINQNCNNPFTFVMIGYCWGKYCDHSLNDLDE